MRRLLCWLGRHDWRLASVQSRGDRIFAGRYVASVYRCRRCAAQRTEATP